MVQWDFVSLLFLAKESCLMHLVCILQGGGEGISAGEMFMETVSDWCRNFPHEIFCATRARPLLKMGQIPWGWKGGLHGHFSPCGEQCDRHHTLSSS